MRTMFKIASASSPALRASLALLLCIGALPAQAALTWQITTVDGASTAGQHTSIALTAAGNPVISYYDSANGDLKLVHCGDAICSTGNRIQTVDSEGTVGQYTSLKLDAAGFPVISYYDVSNADLKLVQCGNVDCSSGNIVRTVDPDATAGQTSLVLDAAGNPVIAYAGGGLRVAHCGDATCGSGNSIQLADTVGTGASMALNAAGHPVVSYFVSVPRSTVPSSGMLKLLRCGDAQCSSGNIVQVLDDTLGSVGSNTSLALDRAGGVPVIAYFDSRTSDLKLLRCGDPACSAGNVAQVVDSVGAVGEFASIALTSEGKPVISYYDRSLQDLKVVQCGDITCLSGNTISTVEALISGSTGQYTALVLDSDGNPVVGYFYSPSSDLKLARLGIDVTPPSVTINQLTEDPTFSRRVRFLVRFSEPVTGLGNDAIVFGGSAGATAARVTSGGFDRTTFTIEVTGMSSSGTVTASVRANAAVDAAGLGNSSSTSTDNTVTYILDDTPPTCVVAVTPNTLWSPNHKLVDVVTTVNISDSGSGPNSAYLYSVTSSEADFGLDPDDVPNDIQWLDSFSPTIQLRSERFAKTGRTYTITYFAGDIVGNIGSCFTTVRVPHSQVE